MRLPILRSFRFAGYAESESPSLCRLESGHRNIAGIHEFLQQFKREAFAHYDIMTVGEASGIPIAEADRWIGEENGSLNMIFQFEHVNLDFDWKDAGIMRSGTWPN